ncbi:MAG: hypothetical protein L3J25_03235 [Flavobacteriaceae bacterium]|nr:hypothetical protein [Flavobacteriaceae bacterium]
MSFQNIIIDQKTPRDIILFTSSFSKGLKLYRFFGYFFLIGSIFLITIAIFKFKMFFPGFIFIAIAIGAFFMIKKVTTKVNSRKETYINGSIINAKVITHGKAFNFLKSTPDYTITVFDTENKVSIRLVFKNKSIWEECPIGKILTGLLYNNNYFFAEELGEKFKAEN